MRACVGVRALVCVCVRMVKMYVVMHIDMHIDMYVCTYASKHACMSVFVVASVFIVYSVV